MVPEAQLPKSPTATTWQAASAAEANPPMASATGAAPSMEAWVNEVKTTRGIMWASTLGWGLVVIGLLFEILALRWTVDNQVDYAPAGIRGIYIAVPMILIGLAVAITFRFVPAQRSTGLDPAAPPEAWARRSVWTWKQLQASRIAAWVGLGLMLLGLLLVAYVYKEYIPAAPEGTNYAPLGIEARFPVWIGIFSVIAGLGFVVWMASTFRTEGYWNAFAASVAASMQSAPPPQAAETGSATGLPGSVTPAQVQSLLRKIDGLLAQLSDDVVSDFSKSPEADTYLKLLSAQPEPAARESRKK